MIPSSDLVRTIPSRTRPQDYNDSRDCRQVVCTNILPVVPSIRLKGLETSSEIGNKNKQSRLPHI